MPFTDNQIEWLEEPLHREHIVQREQSGIKLDYIEAWHAIAEANRIFGFDGWDRETVHTWETSESERKIGKAQRDGWEVGYCARVRIRVRTPNGDVVTREGTGSGTGLAVSRAEAHESAIKEAESDAMKRALMTFGNQFGLALYDKKKRGVTDSAHALKANGNEDWPNFLEKLTSFTDPELCTLWYEDPRVQKKVEKWPLQWRKSAEEEYDKHMQQLYTGKAS